MDDNSTIVPQKQRITLDDGTEAWLHPDGAIRNDKGHWITQPPGAHTITSDDAAALAHRKHMLTQQRINEAIVEQSREHGLDIQAAPDAVGHAAGLLWREIVLNSAERARDRRETWRDITRAGDLLPERSQAATSDANSATITIPAAFAARLAMLMRDNSGANSVQIIDNE